MHHEEQLLLRTQHRVEPAAEVPADKRLRKALMLMYHESGAEASASTPLFIISVAAGAFHQPSPETSVAEGHSQGRAQPHPRHRPICLRHYNCVHAQARVRRAAWLRPSD